MTKNDVLKIISMLEVSYPQHYSKLSQEQLQNQIMLWSDLLADEDANKIANTVKAIIKTDPSQFPPTVGQICSKAYDMFQPKGMTELEAWGHITKAIRNSSYHAKAEWAKLPKEVQSVCSPEQLQEWARDEHFNASVESSNFQRSFRAREKTRQEFDRLPNDTKILISELQQTHRVENKTEYPQIEVTMNEDDIAELSKRFAELGGI